MAEAFEHVYLQQQASDAGKQEVNCRRKLTRKSSVVPAKMQPPAEVCPIGDHETSRKPDMPCSL